MREFIAHLCLITAMIVLGATGARAESEACKGIRIGYHESIPSQGFFGTRTPKSSAPVVSRALARGTELGAKNPYDFNWDAVCRRAKAQHVSLLWVGCRSDTHSESSNFHGISVPPGATIGVVSAECVISKYNRSEKPAFDDLVSTALLHSGGDSIQMWGEGKDRYDVINDEKEREDLYLKALGGTVGMADEDEKDEFRRTHPHEQYVYGVYDTPTNLAACDGRPSDVGAIRFEKKSIGEQR